MIFAHNGVFSFLKKFEYVDVLYYKYRVTFFSNNKGERGVGRERERE